MSETTKAPNSHPIDDDAAALAALGYKQELHRGMSGFSNFAVSFSIISILAGISLLLSPMFGAAVLWWLLGISAVALGIVQLGRAFSLGR